MTTCVEEHGQYSKSVPTEKTLLEVARLPRDVVIIPIPDIASFSAVGNKPQASTSREIFRINWA